MVVWESLGITFQNDHFIKDGTFLTLMVSYIDENYSNLQVVTTEDTIEDLRLNMEESGKHYLLLLVNPGNKVQTTSLSLISTAQ